MRHERQDQIEQALAQKRHDGDAQQERRKSPDDLHELLNKEIHFAAEVTRDRAEAYTDQTRDKHHRERDEKGNAGTVNDSAQNIPSEIIGS